MRRITITHDEKGFNVTENGHTADRLTWDEMLGQVVSLTFPASRRPLYAMHPAIDIVTKDAYHGLTDGLRFDEQGIPK